MKNVSRLKVKARIYSINGDACQFVSMKFSFTFFHEKTEPYAIGKHMVHARRLRSVHRRFLEKFALEKHAYQQPFFSLSKKLSLKAIVRKEHIAFLPNTMTVNGNWRLYESLTTQQSNPLNRTTDCSHDTIEFTSCFDQLNVNLAQCAYWTMRIEKNWPTH